MDEYEITFTGKKGGADAIRVTIVTRDLGSLTAFLSDIQKVIEVKK